ncbi:MAG: hypothetical protein ACRD2C_04760 [Acidimicrobiales bacterium]
MLRAGGWRAATAAATLATFVAMTFAACGGDDDSASSANGDDEEATGATDEPSDEDTDDDPSNAATEAASPEDAAVQLYLDSNDYMETALAANPPNPEDPALSDYFSGSALNENITLLFQVREAGEYYQSTLEGNPVVASTASDEILLTDCVTESITSFDAATDQEKDSGSTVYNWRIRVVDTGSGWRVDEITPQEQTCTP